MADREDRPAGSSITPDDLLAALERSLRGSTPRTRGILAQTARIRHVGLDEAVFLQGAEMPLTLMLRGHGAFRRTTDDGRQIVVGLAGPGDLYGFGSIASTLASVELVALSACDTATWNGADVRRIAAADTRFALDAIDGMAASLVMITEKVDGFLHQDARRRVLRVLGRHRDLFFADPPILSRSHLPSLVGTTREMTGRVLRDLEADGTVARVGRTGLALLRPERLDVDMAPPSRTRALAT